MGLWNSPEAESTLADAWPSEKGLACCCKHNAGDYIRKFCYSGIYFRRASPW